ncbi:MAG: type IV pilus modification protein PilV [Telluria sp.]
MVRARSPAGFTLIEVLVALFVLSVGLLGAAAMQSRARALRAEARLHATATQLAASLAEEMRANRVAMSAPDGANPYLNIDIDSGAGAPVQPAQSCYGASACTPAELARSDIDDTARALRDAFPRARLVVCRDASPWDAASSTLLWNCDGSSGAPVVIKIGWRGKDGSAGLTPGLALVASGGAP